MATIGTFARTGDGFNGTVSTLILDAKVQVRPAEKSSDKAPDFRIFSGRAEIAAAWKKTSNEGRDYLSVSRYLWPAAVAPGRQLRHGDPQPKRPVELTMI